jgi:hypothetical protein
MTTESKDKREGFYRTLEAGQRVCIEKYYSGHGAYYSFSKVTKVTPTGLIKIGSNTYRQDGRGVGGYGGSIVQYTDQIEQQMKRNQLLNTLPKKLTSYELKQLTTEQLENIAAIIAQGKEDVE